MNDLDQYRDWLLRNLVAADLAVSNARDAMRDAQTDGAAQDAFTDAADQWRLSYDVQQDINRSLRHVDEYRLWLRTQTKA